jgi:hypothetical protein
MPNRTASSYSVPLPVRMSISLSAPAGLRALRGQDDEPCLHAVVGVVEVLDVVALGGVGDRRAEVDRALGVHRDQRRRGRFRLGRRVLGRRAHAVRGPANRRRSCG